jgi:hypothetical protein
MEKRAQLLQPPEMTTSIEVKESARPLIKEIQRIPRRLKKLIAKLPQQEVLQCLIPGYQNNETVSDELCVICCSLSLLFLLHKWAVLF